MKQAPIICTWDSLQQKQPINNYVITPKTTVKPSADITFVVDATGSMGDEIEFLKNDLVDIIGKASAIRPDITMRTAALFYRDEGDEYVTRHADFTEKLSSTAEFVNNQRADGGGDYPEAVHTALEKMLQQLSWNAKARTRLAFLILDAPAHYEQGIISSLQQSFKTCAKMGIRLIPVAASGVDKNTEFMLRFFAITTGGTYVFITDDSTTGFNTRYILLTSWSVLKKKQFRGPCLPYFIENLLERIAACEEEQQYGNIVIGWVFCHNLFCFMLIIMR
jgi:hypothetical protein